MTRGEVGGAGVGRGMPSGYVEVASPAGRWITRPGPAGEIAAGGLDDLLNEAAHGRPAAGGGRRPLEFLRLGGNEAVAKRPVHGGLFGRFCGGLYWGSGRLPAQIRAAQRLHSCGVPTPEILAVGWRRVSGPLQRHAIVSAAIPGAINLYDAFRTMAPGPSRRSILRQAALTVRRMHEARFLHADLNVTNLVIEPRPERPAVQVVDLDRGRFLVDLNLHHRARNLGRLLRSYEKWLAEAAPLGGREEIFFLRCYAGDDRAMLRWLVAYLRRYRRSLIARRLSWRMRQGGPSRPGMVDRSR